MKSICPPKFHLRTGLKTKDLSFGATFSTFFHRPNRTTEVKTMVRKSPGMSRDGPSLCPIQELVELGVGNNISDINGHEIHVFFSYSNKWTHPGFFFFLGGVGYI